MLLDPDRDPSIGLADATCCQQTNRQYTSFLLRSPFRVSSGVCSLNHSRFYGFPSLLRHFKNPNATILLPLVTVVSVAGPFDGTPNIKPSALHRRRIVWCFVDLDFFAGRRSHNFSMTDICHIYAHVILIHGKRRMADGTLRHFAIWD